MRHNFTLEDKTGKRWKKTSTLVGTGKSVHEGGPSLTSLTVGATAGIAARLVLTGQVKQRGVISPVTKDIYEPALAELEKLGVVLGGEDMRFAMRPKL